MRLHRGRPQHGRPQVEVKIVERAYLGEFWDYVVAPVHGSMRIKVTAPPLEIYEVDDAAWLEFDPKQMASIA
jgi:iron(III) transport system ATP-binding protein